MENKELKEFKEYIEKCIDILWLLGEVKGEKDDILRLSKFLDIEHFTIKKEVSEYGISLADIIENKLKNNAIP